LVRLELLNGPNRSLVEKTMLLSATRDFEPEPV
jgi:hypothetical protein